VSSNATYYEYVERAKPQHRYWLHLLLLVLTLITTSVVGAGLADGFAAGRPFRIEDIFGYDLAWSNPAYMLRGLPFSLTLVGVLLVHEMGHYVAARYYHVDASLPYFLPVPTLLGTFGAFIRIRSAILTNRILFDVGVSGPLAGFAALLLPLIAGISLSKVMPGVAAHGDIIFGTPLLLRAVEWAKFPGVPVTDIYLHPVARGAWVGILATAVNLLPIGQLDGGHILYPFLGDRVKYVSWFVVAIFVPLGFFSHTWWLWAVVLFFLGIRHPSIVDPVPIGSARTRLALVALVVFVVCFTPTPV
jgi:membrane-associated protease RseP (regulator of RpoE activity)